MVLRSRARRLAGIFAVCALALGSAPAFSQDIPESHLKAARDAIAAIHVTDRFDDILPRAAIAMKSDLLRNNPDQETLINQTVDEKTLAIAPRRGDLEKEAAMAFARAFTEDELNAIAAFYNTPAGKKFIEQGPQTTAEVYKAADIWQRGVARDLAQSVAEALQAKLPKPAQAPAPAPAAAGGAAAAPAADPDDAPAAAPKKTN